MMASSLTNPWEGSTHRPPMQGPCSTPWDAGQSFSVLQTRARHEANATAPPMLVQTPTIRPGEWTTSLPACPGPGICSTLHGSPSPHAARYFWPSVSVTTASNGWSQPVPDHSATVANDRNAIRMIGRNSFARVRERETSTARLAHFMTAEITGGSGPDATPVDTPPAQRPFSHPAASE